MLKSHILFGMWDLFAIFALLKRMYDLKKNNHTMNKKITARFSGNARMLDMANYMEYLTKVGIYGMHVQFDDFGKWIEVSYENDDMALDAEEALENNKTYCELTNIEAELSIE